MKNRRQKLDVLFKVFYILLLIAILFIAIYGSYKDLASWSVLFWIAVVWVILLRFIQYYIYHNIEFDFYDIEEIEYNEDGLINKILKGLKLGNEESIINEEKFKLSTYVNKIGSKGLLYVKSDFINGNKMLVVKKHLDEFNKKYSGYRIYVYLDIVTYTKEVEIMLKQFTNFTDRFKFIDIGFGDVDNNIMVLSYSSKDRKFRIGGTSYRYNMNDYKKVKKEIKKIVRK